VEAGFRLERDEQRRRLVITLSARATVEVWSAVVSTVIAGDAWGYPAIFDMSAVESTPLLVNLPNLAQIAEQLSRTHGRPDPVAVVVQEADVELWRQRLATVFGPLLTIEAFSDVAAAGRWLDRVGPNERGER
jgi:hypothetical protein